MAGAFDGLLSDSGAGPGNLTADQLRQVMAQRQGGGGYGGGSSVGPGTYRYWLPQEQLAAEDPRAFMLNYAPGYRDVGSPESGMWEADPSADQTYITRLRPDTGGNLGDRWDQNGVYQGTVQLQNGGGRDLNQAIALMAGGYFGGQYLGGLNGAETAANGAFLGEGVASGVGAWDAAALGAGNTLGGTAATVGGTTLGTGAQSGLQTFGNGLKTLGISGGDLLKTGAAFALSKDVETKADPSVTAAINGLKTTTDAANARAQSNDEYWRTTFAPRYLQAMDDQISMGRQLNDFNMGLAKKYDSRYWNTTARQQDAFYDQVNSYDTDAARARIAGEAGANADMQNAAAMQALVRDLNRRGLNPNSGLVMSNMRQQAQQGALQKTMAMNMAREAARKEGLNMRAVAAGLGGNLTGASAGFAGQAGQSAGLGMNGINNANQGFNSNVGNWNATTGLGLSGLNSLGNLGMGLTTGNNRANELNTLGFNQMLGYGLGMFGSGKGG